MGGSSTDKKVGGNDMLPIFACAMLCGPQTDVSVTATAVAEAHSQTHFRVVPGNPAVPPADPQFLEYAGEVGRALISQGFQPAAGPGDADMVVEIAWGVGDPHTVTRRVANDSYQNMGNQAGGVPAGKGGMPAGDHNNASFGWVQGAPVKVAETVYVQTFALKAYGGAAWRKEPAQVPLWEVTAQSEGDAYLPPSVPVIMAAAAPYFAQNPGHPVKTKAGAADQLAKYVRGDIAAPPARAAR
jgi:hypothetical protein